MSSKARRPYLMNKKSVTQFYQAPVRYLREIEARESEFEKPYVDEDYRKMHLDFPWPDFPPFPPLSPWPPLPPFDGPVPGLPGCAIVCYPPHLDCDNPVWCHPSIWCGSDIGCTLCTWEVEGAVKGYTSHASGVGSWGIDIWIDEDLVEAGGEALISACMTDPCGNVCCQDIEVTCKVCPPDISISWDTAGSDETIGQGNGGLATAVVAVLDGLGPYQWSVAGQGFSMLHAETSGKGNTLQADDTACGTATITVTDDCDETTTGYVRCTAVSHWERKEDCECCPSACNQPLKAGCLQDIDFLYDGNKKWGLAGNHAYEIADNDCPPTWGRYPGCTGACDNPPPCGTPAGCGSGTPPSGWVCISYYMVYWEWECN